MFDQAIYQFLLSTDGLNQLERTSLALDPSSVNIDGRTSSDLLRFLYALSEQIRFYDLNNQAQGDWRPFLELLKVGGSIPDEAQLSNLLQSRDDWPPHIALLMAFLHLYSYAQQDINTLPLRRLNFYYQDVLGTRRRQALADQVHVLFELSKNATPVLLSQGALLSAGNAANGVPLNYALDSDYVISKTQIARLMTSFSDRDLSGRHMIFKAGEATTVHEASGAWKPFGLEQLRTAEELRMMKAASIGCALASPNFFLAEGARTVTVTLHLKSLDFVPPPGLDLRNALDIKMTAESGWIMPDSVLQARLVSSPPPESDPGESAPQEIDSTLTVSILFNEAAPGITAYNEEVHQTRLKTQWPALSLSPKPDSFLIDLLDGFTVSEVQIAVESKGLRTLVLQNDQVLQSADAPVIPFGNIPRIGSNFYLGSIEAFSKSITSLSVRLQWQDPPADMAAHYAGYDNPNINNGIFQAHLYLLAGKKWNKLTASPETLFSEQGGGDIAPDKTIVISPTEVIQQTEGTDYKRLPGMEAVSSFNHQIRQGFLRLELTGPGTQDAGNLPADAPFEAFGHKSFPTIYTRHAIEIGQGGTATLPQPPYTPALSSVTIDYTAGDTFKPDIPNHVEQFFLLDVFGTAEPEAAQPARLVPSHSYQGALYIGLQNATVPQLLSMLFQLEEGSAPGAELLRPEDITWSYLAGNQWKQLSKGDVLEDKTEGFQIPGLVRLNIGEDATSEHTLMLPGFHWIRASVASNAEGAASVLNIHAQAARATLQIPAGAESDLDEHLSEPLAPDLIASLTNKQPAIKKVRQPYPSFGGRPSESNTGYHRRVHERLFHRNRAVSRLDYERIVLESFPAVFKVKCLPHTNAENELSPGEVKLVVVPDWRKRPTGDPLQPRANGAFLREVEEFVEGTHTALFSDVNVSNPAYETLLVDSKVHFRTGFDPGFHVALLEEDIKRFLSPWAYDEGEDIVFGGKVHASEILAFMEGRHYIDHVVDFELYHRYEGDPGGGIGTMKIGEDFVIGLTPEPTVGPSGIGKVIGEDFVVGIPVSVAPATRPDAIIVSSRSHRISTLTEGAKVCQGIQNIGIGQMIIGLDFIVVS